VFDIGFIELLLIGVVGLIVVGPERLPKVASTLGRWVGRARHFVSNVKNDIDREMRQEQIREALGRDADLNEIKDIINDSKYTIENEVASAKEDYVVAARDDDPARESSRDESSQDESSQQQQILDQEDDFDDYGLTDHTDHSAELDREYEASQAKSDKTNADNGRRNNKSNG